MLHNRKGGYAISPYCWWRVWVGLGGYHTSLRVVEYGAAQRGGGGGGGGGLSEIDPDASKKA